MTGISGPAFDHENGIDRPIKRQTVHCPCGTEYLASDYMRDKCPDCKRTFGSYMHTERQYKDTSIVGNYLRGRQFNG